MNIKQIFPAVFLALFTSLGEYNSALADGLIIVPCPPIYLPGAATLVPGVSPLSPPIARCPTAYLSVKNHNVSVTIENQVARTHVDETFTNDSGNSVEGMYIFPLPDDAAISDFAMWVDGKKLQGQVLDKNQALRAYEDIVRTQRDPGLLEYVGRNAFQARIYPIPPHSDKRVEIEYSQILRAESGLVRYVYPLDTEKFSPQSIKNVSVNVAIRSPVAMRTIYSPSHEVSVSRDGENRATVGYEATNVKPDRDYVLYYSVSQDSIGLNILSYRTGGDDGYFLMLVAPQLQNSSRQLVDRNVILVLDTSGSMQGPKIDQAKRALYYILDQLNSRDRFNVIAFSTGTNPFASSLQPLTKRNEAKEFVAHLRAEGSTDINRALLEAIANANTERPTTIIFLTDGLPTIGETNSQRIIANSLNAASNASRISLFTFGIGDDVNAVLLDSLAEKMRGASGYVRPNEKIDEIVSAFYTQVSSPVLADVSIDWGGASVSDVYPYPLPDLFAGTQLVVAGRYRGGGNATITLKGTVNGSSQSFRYGDASFRATGGDETTPRLWATRKIGYLLNQIRLQGESREIVNDIVTLAVRYGIVTPYTSFLIDERQDVLTPSGRSEAARQVQATAAPAEPRVSGAGAVQQSKDQNQLRGANIAPAAPTAAATPSRAGSVNQLTTAPLQLVGDKTFILRGALWSDTQFDPSKMKTIKIEFASDAYYAFAANNPDWGKYLALGSHVIFIGNGIAYEITDDSTGAKDPIAATTAAPSAISRGGSDAPIAQVSPATPVVSPPKGSIFASSGWANAFETGIAVAIGVVGLCIAGGVGLVVFFARKNP